MYRDEDEFVGWLRRQAPQKGGRVRLGIGDDAALVGPARGSDLILTTDLSIEGVHFRRRLHPPHSVGHRALARAMSDIAAMGGTPRFALVSLAVSKRMSRRWIEDFYAGLFDLAKRFGVAVIGGDTAVVSGRTAVDVIVAGEVPRGRALRRSGARPGDQIFVSGRLGLSALGLRLLRSGQAHPTVSARRSGAEVAVRAAALAAHLYPLPQCALGRYLMEKRLASAMIDISDGLSTDLARLCAASRVGAWIGGALIPRPEGSESRRGRGGDPLGLALHGGEDYQLVFTVPRPKVTELPRLFRGVALHWIGTIRASRRLVLLRADGTKETLRPGGWDHFRNLPG